MTEIQTGMTDTSITHNEAYKSMSGLQFMIFLPPEEPDRLLSGSSDYTDIIAVLACYTIL